MEFLDQILNSFTAAVGSWELFIVNLVVLSALCYGVAQFYVRFGRALSNRSRFAHNFLPLGLTTMLIMSIVKSNFALSLGLVGALSIVRFRAAIKDPEELTYLFLIIALGLCAGSSQPLAALIMTLVILGFMYLARRKSGQVQGEDRLFLHLSSRSLQDAAIVENLVAKHLREVQLKRLDWHPEQGLDLSFSTARAEAKVLQGLQEELRLLAGDLRLSIIEQPDLNA